jgi:hypothetical protein
MVKKIKSWFNIVFLLLVLITPGLVFGGTKTIKEDASPINRLNGVAVESGPYSQEANSTTLAATLGIVISTVLSILGVIFLIITIMAGYKWMMAQGNEKAVSEAKDSITRAVIGLIVVISSYAVWTFIKNNFISKI